jgi:predicted Rdx family selenoprotein
MELIHPAECTNCGMEATMRCAGCMGAPDYHLGESLKVVYCGRDCQRKHWPDHKTHCRVMKQRRKLLRAANVLQAALLTYREVLHDIDLTKIEAKDGFLYIYQNQRSITARVKQGLFPNHLTTNVQHKEAALTINQCTTAMALLGRLTRKLLSGKYSRIGTSGRVNFF